MTRLPDDLALITAKTLEHYSEGAAEFWDRTRDHDVKQNIEALLQHIRGAPPLRILDFCCGPGRDLAAFRALGREPIGLEGSPPLAAMAREQLSELRAALKPDGVLFTSNPRGNNEEGWNRGRYGAYHDLESWRAFLETAALTELEHDYRPPGSPLERQPWLASVWRKSGASGEI